MAKCKNINFGLLSILIIMVLYNITSHNTVCQQPSESPNKKYRLPETIKITASTTEPVAPITTATLEITTAGVALTATTISPLRAILKYLPIQSSLEPAKRLGKLKTYFDLIIGIPTVKRDKESYLIETLSSLITQANNRNL